MPRGIALTIGLNSVDPGHYAGWSGVLNACEADAEDMGAVARSRDYATTTLLTTDATRDRVSGLILDAANTLEPADALYLAYSGHGGQVPDWDDEEPDAQDETWCLYDGQMVDDELYTLLSKLKEGVRVFVTSDSCHSGTVTKFAYYQGTVTTRNPLLAPGELRYRAMPPDVALRTYRKNKVFYDKILRNTQLEKAKASVRASVLLISGCQDNQLSADGAFNGLFTSQLLRVWANGKFPGNYREFHEEIVRRMPPDQTPNYFWAGSPNMQFETQRPFTL